MIGFWRRCLFTDIVAFDATGRAEMGDRAWHALLEAHDAVVRVATQSVPLVVRLKHRATASLAMFDGPASERFAARWRLVMRCSRCGIEVRAGTAHRRSERCVAMTSSGIGGRFGARVGARPWLGPTTCWCPARCATW